MDGVTILVIIKVDNTLQNKVKVLIIANDIILDLFVLLLYISKTFKKSSELGRIVL